MCSLLHWLLHGSEHMQSDDAWEGGTQEMDWRLPQQTVLPLSKQEAGRLCFNQLIASLGIQQAARVL